MNHSATIQRIGVSFILLFLLVGCVSGSYFVYQPIGSVEEDYSKLPKEAACYFFLTKWKTKDK